MSNTVEAEARRALARLRRASEKLRREMESLQSAIQRAEGSDFPSEEYAEVAGLIDRIGDFTEVEGRRLQGKILQAGGLEPGRIRRSSSL